MFIDEVLLPKIDPAAVDRLTAYLRGKSWSQRPAHATARVLALIVRLWEDRREFPTRAAVAAHVGVSVPTVDLVLRRHRTGEIMVVYEAAEPVLRGRRWVVPDKEIRRIGKSANGESADGELSVTNEKAPYRRRHQSRADSSMVLT